MQHDLKGTDYIIFLLIITLMSSLGLIASDIYLPALPKICLFFNRSSLEVQGTLSIYLLGLSLFQLVYGTLSDSIGRKKTVLIGIVVFVSGTIICATIDSFILLLCGRFLQGVGACSGMVIGRSIIADRYDPSEAGKVLTTIFPIIGMSPAISPVIGGYLTRFMEWQSIFIATAVIAVILFCLVLFCLEESLPVEKRCPINMTVLKDSYKRVLSHRMFAGYTLLVCSAYGGYFAYLSASPFILDKLGYTADKIGGFYVNLSICYIAGNLTARKFIDHLSIDNTLKIGSSLFFTSLLIMYMFTHFCSLGFFAILIPISLLTFANGFLLPLGVSKAVTIIPEIRGTASGIMGAFQLFSGAVAAFLIGLHSDHSLISLSSRMIFINILIIAAAYMIWSDREPLLKETLSSAE